MTRARSLTPCFTGKRPVHQAWAWGLRVLFCPRVQSCFVRVRHVCSVLRGRNHGMSAVRGWHGMLHLHGGDVGSLCRVSLAPYCCWASSRRRFQPSRSRLLWASPSISPPALSCFQWLYHWPLPGRVFEGPVRTRVFPYQSFGTSRTKFAFAPFAIRVIRCQFSQKEHHCATNLDGTTSAHQRQLPVSWIGTTNTAPQVSEQTPVCTL